MGENTTIPFTHHTWNPWRGCQHALLKDGMPHPGCRRCYAETMSRRNPVTLGVWGDEGTRPIGTEAYWKLPYKWAKAAKEAGERHRVFMSLADPFEDRDELRPHRARQFQTIDETADWLDYLLFTKRPQHAQKLWPGRHNRPFNCGLMYRKNVWIIYSASDQHSLESWLPELFQLRYVVPVLGISAEPLLDQIDFTKVRRLDDPKEMHYSALHSQSEDCFWSIAGAPLDWVLLGGETGGGCQELNLDHLRRAANQCLSAGVPIWVKQDSGLFPDRQGRIPDEFWQLKELPEVAA